MPCDTTADPALSRDLDSFIRHADPLPRLERAGWVAPIAAGFFAAAIVGFFLALLGTCALFMASLAGWVGEADALGWSGSLLWVSPACGVAGGAAALGACAAGRI